MSAGDEFGNAIDIDGGVVAVAWRQMSLAKLPELPTYLMSLPAHNWRNCFDEGNNFQTFGVSVAIDAGVVAVGARTFCIG